jgi:hypothetical protein
MPVKVSRQTQRRASTRLIELSKHMRSCRDCVRARKMGEPLMMCKTGTVMTLNAANDLADIFRLRIAAHTKHPGAIFACPDLTLHGAAYALTATPYMVTAIQDALF